MQTNSKKININNINKNGPIKLEDLIPRNDVSGGGKKTVFGIIRNSIKKQKGRSNNN